MATNRSFSDMLNEYLPNRLLKNELLKRDWFLQNVQKDESWAGSNIIVPFIGSQASSMAVGSLVDSTDIAEDDYVRGQISDYVEVYGSMLFNYRDLVDHDGKIPEATFLKILPDAVDRFVDYMKNMTSRLLIDGDSFAKATADGQAGGTIVVDRIQYFEIGQKLVLDDDNSSPGTYYVIAVNINTSTVTLSATRGGGAANISAYTLAQNAKFYIPGAQGASFVSLKSGLLSLANGGSTALHGVTKTLWPFLQAVNVDGSTVTAANLLDSIFSAYTQIQQKARGGKCSTIVMSLQNLGVVLQLIQTEKGPFHVAPNQTKVSEYGWTEIMIGSPAGMMLKLVGVQEASNSEIYFLDMKSMTFRTKQFFKRIKSPDGLEFFTSRATTGYTYIVDHALYGENEITKPGNNGVLYGISITY